MLEKVHNLFIDNFLQTFSIEQAAMAAGIPKAEALRAGVDFLRNPEIAAELEERKARLDEAYGAINIDKKSLLRLLFTQYETANKLEKTKEAADILVRIAETQGYDFKTINTEPIQFVINNLDETKL